MKFILVLLLLFSSLNFAQNKNNIIVVPISKFDLKELIKNRNGKSLLVNIWASWCIPCREEFPDLVQLSNNYKEKLDVVAISVDYNDEIEMKVVPFLIQNHVRFPVYINGFEKDEELINFLNSSWNGALPGTFIYDTNGKQVIFLDGKQSYERFSSIIENL
jgi:thiol-disulfide isomerase/thioredoxin